MADKISIFRSYDLLIEEFVKWAEPRSDIRAAMIIGSRARQDRPAEEWADLDMVIVTTNPGQYVSTADWVKNMGNPLLTFMESTAGGDENERRVLYEGMLDVDFAIFPVEKMKQFQQGRLSPQMEMQIANAVGRGMRILLDKDGTLAELRRMIPSGEVTPKTSDTERVSGSHQRFSLSHGVDGKTSAKRRIMAGRHRHQLPPE